MTGGRLDAVHELWLRGLGAHMIVFGVSWYTLRNSDDRRMFSTQMLSRAVVHSLQTIITSTSQHLPQTLIMMIIAVGYSTYHLWSRKGSHFNEKFAMLYIGIFAAALVGNIIHTLRGGPIGKHFLSLS